MDMSKYKSMFLSETEEHLRNMSALLVAVENDPADRDGIDALFRDAHSIKGMAASMGYTQMADLAHHLEDFLADFRKAGTIDPAAIDHLLQGTDLIEEVLAEIAADRPEPDVSAFMFAAPQAEDAPQNEHRLRLTLRENVVAPGARLLLLMGVFSEMGQIAAQRPSMEELKAGGAHRKIQFVLTGSLSRATIEEKVQCYPEVAELSFSDPGGEREPERRKQDRRQNSLASGTVRVDTVLLDRFINLTGELLTTRYALKTALKEQDLRELGEGLGQLEKLVGNLHSQVLKMRMMPVSTVTGRLPRVVRDLCRSNGKEIELKISGAGIELDRSILEEMSDPLMHLVRNAVDHGIERSGTVCIDVLRTRSHVQLRIEDDGRGMDPQLLRRRAREKGLIGERQAEVMRDADALQLICLPGFSTVDRVSETSGRGVGMDVVRSAVENLGGSLLIDAAPQAGTRITVTLPLSVAIIKILLFECAGKLLAMPLSRVIQTQLLSADKVLRRGKQRVFELKGETLPLLSLRKILGFSSPQGPTSLAVIVMELFGRRVGLVVDHFCGHQDVFVKKLPPPFDRLRGTGGGAVLGDGRVVFILDVQSLLEQQR